MANTSTRDIYRTLADLKEDLEEGTDFRILRKDRRSNVFIVAPHGGYIEPGTSHLARAIAGNTFNLFDFQGLRIQEPWRLHVTSTRFRDDRLTVSLMSSLTAVSIHGMGKTDNWRIWTGGLNKELKFLVEACLIEAGFWIESTPPKYKGKSPRNFINLAEKYGVQLELPEDLVKVMFRNGIEFTDQEQGNEPALNDLGEHFVQALRRALFLYLPGRLLPRP